MLESLPPKLAPLAMMPAKDAVANSARYVLGPQALLAVKAPLTPEQIDFNVEPEVLTQDYTSSDGPLALTIIDYPTPQIAGDHLRQIEAHLKTAGPSAGTVVLRREGPLVLATTGAWAEGDAKAMVEGIHLRNQVTFDKKMPLEFHAEVQKTYSLLTSIAVFCGKTSAISSFNSAARASPARCRVRIAPIPWP